MTTHCYHDCTLTMTKHWYMCVCVWNSVFLYHFPCHSYWHVHLFETFGWLTKLKENCLKCAVNSKNTSPLWSIWFSVLGEALSNHSNPTKYTGKEKQVLMHTSRPLERWERPIQSQALGKRGTKFRRKWSHNKAPLRTNGDWVKAAYLCRIPVNQKQAYWSATVMLK